METKEEFLKKQKELLVKEKEQTQEKIKSLKKYPDYGTDEEDNIQEVEDFETNLSIDDQLELLLKKIDKSLKAIENGTYGICIQCGNRIEDGRLKAMPYAELCATCKSKKQ